MKTMVKNRMIIILLICLLIFTITVSAATPIPICTATGDQYNPAISDDTIVWSDNRNGENSIYRWDTVNGEQRVTTNPSSAKIFPAISGDTIVWSDNRNYFLGGFYWDIYKWDPVNGEKRVTSNGADIGAISGNTIVYDVPREGGPDIYKWDPIHGEQPVCTNPARQQWQAISSDTIVWEDYRNGNSDIYKWDPIHGEQPVCTNSTDQWTPKISGDTIVWVDNRNGNADIYKWDPVNGEQPVCTDPANQYNPAISGDTIVWMDNRNGNWDIYKWDPVNGEQPVCTDPANQYNPAISGDTIVWEDYRNGNADIYAINITPKPILLVWGWGGNEENWNVIKPELESKGYSVEILQYDSSQRADYCAQNYVTPKVNEMLKTYNTSKIDIVAHSYGGLVARSYIEKFGGDKNVDHLMMLFTPNKGTLMADYVTGEKTGISPNLLDLMLNVFSGFHPTKGWGSNYDLVASSNNQFLVDLNNNFNIQGKKYYAIAGYAPYPDSYILGLNIGKPTSNALVSPGHDDGFITMDSVRGLPGVPSYCAELDHSDVNPFSEPKYDGPTLSTRLNTIRSVVDNVIIPALNDNPVIVDNCPTTPDPNDDKGLPGLLSHMFVQVKPGQAVNGNFRNNGGSIEIGFIWPLPELKVQSYYQVLDSSPMPNFTFSLLSPSGKIITPSSVNTDPNIQFTMADNYWRYSVNNSETGIWKYFITPIELEGTDINITAMAIGDVEIIPEQPVVVFPGFANPPTDPDSDGLYEDLNGNARKDFNDVVLMFNQMQWIAANEPVSAFDFNGNGRIDFNDIVKLFGEI
jgi:TolB protein